LRCTGAIAGLQVFGAAYENHFGGTAGAVVPTYVAWNSFIELKSVLYTPHPSRVPVPREKNTRYIGFRPIKLEAE
jgi:hypothetical protein